MPPNILPSPDWAVLGPRILGQAEVTLMLLQSSMEYPDDSEFAQLSQGQERHQRDMIRPTVVSEAIASARMSLVVATDLVHAIGQTMVPVGIMPVMGFAIGSLTRSVIETLGRAHFIISAPDQDELLRRWMILRISTAATTVMESALDLDRTAQDHATLRRLREAADALQISKQERSMSFARMAIDLIDSSLAWRRGPGPRANGSTEYSFLSSLAHGEASGHAQMTTVLSRGDASFGLNYTAVGMNEETWSRCALLLIPALLTTVPAFLRASAVDEADIARWCEDTLRAFQATAPSPSYMSESACNDETPPATSE